MQIEIGKRCDAYHDGKKSPSRLVSVVIDDIIPRDQLSKKAQRLWKKALKEDFDGVFNGCVYYISSTGTTKQFWDWNCTEFIEGHIPGDEESTKDPMLFAKRPGGTWYGVNWNYFLDVSGRVRKRNHKDWAMCAEECNKVMKWNRKLGRYEYFDMLTGKKVGGLVLGGKGSRPWLEPSS